MKAFRSLTRNDQLYIIFAIISLVMYIFGHSTEAGQLPFPDKLFYVPCAISLILAGFSPKYWKFGKDDLLFLLFWTIAFISTSITASINFDTIFSGLIGYLVFRHLKNVNYKIVIELLLYICPMVVAIHYLFSNPLSLAAGHRYGGFQGDPNCFSFAINVFVFACGYIISYSSIKWEKLLAVGCILSIIPLILAAASRGNVAITFFILLYSFKDVIKRNKAIALIIILITIIGGARYLSRFSNQIKFVSSRYEEMEGSSNYRSQEFLIAPAVLLAHPEYILLGIGYNESINANSRFPNEYYHNGRAHNSYMSILLEEGILGFILFMSFLYQKFKVVWNNRKQPDGKYLLIMMFCILFFFYTIYCLPFLPFWFILNLVSNTSENYETNNAI